MEITLKELKEKYEEAVQDKKNTFYLGDAVVLVDYAKYLIEYLESLKKNKNKKN